MSIAPEFRLQPVSAARRQRNTIIEDIPQVSSNRRRPARLLEKPVVTSPMSDDFPTPRAILLSSRSQVKMTLPTHSNEQGLSEQERSISALSYDEMYDLSDSELEEVEIRLSKSVKKRINPHVKAARCPSLVIPSPSHWPTIEKLQSATPLSPPIQVQIPAASLQKLAVRAGSVPSSSSAPSLDGSTSGDDAASLSSCPSTPELSQHGDDELPWELPIQLDPSSLTLLHQLTPGDGSPQQQDTVIEVPAAIMEEMREVNLSPSLTLPTRIDTKNVKPVVSIDPEDELSALSIPSPGGFFASLDAATRHTWAASDAAPSTSIATEFYDLPFRTERSSAVVLTSTATEFYDLPWGAQPANTVEQVIAIPSPVEDTNDPITARKGMFSPAELVKEVVEIDEQYGEVQKEKTTANFDRTALWINAQDTYMKTICEDDDIDVTDSFKDIADAVPRTPDQEPSKPLDENSPGKKSVRFAEETVSDGGNEAKAETKARRISPIHDGTFWEGWRHTKRSQRARDVFQHRQQRAEAEHVKRTSCQTKHLQQLKGTYEIKSTLRPEQARPISFLPEATEEEKKAALQQVERERQALDQMSASSWHVSAQKEINGGKLITSPVVQTFRARDNVRILDLHGQVQCSWAWNVAMEHADAMIYTIASSDAEAHVMESQLEGPENHIVSVAPKPWELPFEDGFFDVVSARNLYAHLRTLFPKGYSADEWDLTLRECRRVLKPGGYLEFHLLDAELMHPESTAQALGVEFAFNLKTRGYDPCSGRNFLPRLKRAGFTDIKRAWMALPTADVLPRWVDTGKNGSGNSAVPRPSIDSARSNKSHGSAASTTARSVAPNRSSDAQSMQGTLVTGSTKDVRAITGLVGARMWEQWMLKLNCEMGRSETRCLESVAKALEEGGQSSAAWRCLVGWARKEN